MTLVSRYTFGCMLPCYAQASVASTVPNTTAPAAGAQPEDERPSVSLHPLRFTPGVRQIHLQNSQIRA